MSGTPNPQDILNNFMEGGWEGFANAEEANKAAQEQTSDEKYDLAAAFAATFSTPHGARVLDHLFDITLRRVTWDGNLPLDQATAYGLMREGQNQLVAIIMQQLNTAAEGPPGVPSPTKKPNKGKKRARKK